MGVFVTPNAEATCTLGMRYFTPVAQVMPSARTVFGPAPNA